MADGILDFVMGRGPLKKAAGETVPKVPAVTSPANIDVAGEAAKLAKKKRATASANAAEAVSQPATKRKIPLTPLPNAADAIGKQLMGR